MKRRWNGQAVILRVGCFAAGLLLAGSNAAFAGNNPQVTVDPQAGPAGTNVSVDGTGFGPLACGVEVFLDEIGGTSLGNTSVANGSFSVEVTIPAGTASGPHKIIARGLVFSGEFCTGDSGESASTDFRVIGGPQAVERLTIEFLADDVDRGLSTFNLLSRTRVTMVLPPSDDLPSGRGAQELSGFWYELQLGDGSVKYRRIITNPIRVVFEGPDPDNGSMFPDRKEAIPSNRIFNLLIPAPTSGDVLVLFSSPLTLDGQAGPAEEIGRIILVDPIPRSRQ